MLYANYILIKLENRKKNSASHRNLHKNRSICVLGMLFLSSWLIFVRHYPSYKQTPAIEFLVVVVVFKITPNVNSLGPCSASSRCDSSMKSIWDFQWTLKRVAMVSKDYMSRATTCQSPSQRHSMASLGSPAARKRCSGVGVRAMRLSVSASSDPLSRLMSSPNWLEASHTDLLTLGKEHTWPPPRCQAPCPPCIV